MYENGLDVETLTINAFWDSVMKGVVIKKYPERQIKENENAIIYELEYVYYYQYYSYYYKYDDFMCLYLGLEVGTDWKALVNEYAKEQVAQQLVFYHIMNLENMKPDADEYDVLFDEYLASALESSDIKPEKYDTDEAYQAAKEEYKKKLIESKGEEYFKSMIYYKIGIEKIISYANVVELGE